MMGCSGSLARQSPFYEKIKQNTNTEHKHFIYADGQLIAIHIKTALVKLFGLLNEVHWMVLSLFLVMLPLAS
jgi:hypothetical protein